MSEFKLYHSVKLVHAQPLTDVAFNEYISALYEVHTLANINKVTCGFKRVDEANPIEGYLVIYNKAQPNQYISWCPKAEFEEGNVACDVVVNLPRIDYRHAMLRGEPHIVSEVVSYETYLRVIAELTTGRFVNFKKMDGYVGDKKNYGHIVVDLVEEEIDWVWCMFTDFVYGDYIPGADFLQELLSDTPLEV